MSGTIRGVLALVLVGLIGLAPVIAQAGETSEDKQGRPARTDERIQVVGKVFCPLKRGVFLPFAGVISEVLATTGQMVQEDQILVRYRLQPMALQELRRKVTGSEIASLKGKQAELRAQVAQLSWKRKEAAQLVDENLGPAGALRELDSALGTLVQQKKSLDIQVQRAKDIYDQDLQLLGKYLDGEVGQGHVPETGVLTAPISGHVLQVNPELKTLAELPSETPVMMIGIMDPMVVRTQVHELEVIRIKSGDPAVFIPDIAPDLTFAATVTQVFWTPTDSNPEKPSFYLVELSVPNPKLELKEGYRGKVVFD